VRREGKMEIGLFFTGLILASCFFSIVTRSWKFIQKRLAAYNQEYKDDWYYFFKRSALTGKD
jgi:hypothetical protein